MQCLQLSTAEICYTNAGGATQTLIAHYEYRLNSVGNPVVHGVRYTTPDGVPVDTSTGTVAAGSCPISPPDVEWEQLCDVSAAGVVTEFFRRSITSFNASGVPVTAVTDWQMDKITAYVPTGTVAACNRDCDVVPPVGVVTTWG